MNQVVIGATIDSLRYAFKHNISVIYTDIKTPHRFTGYLEEYTHLVFCLSLAGKLRKASQIRIVDEGVRATIGRTPQAFNDVEFLFFDDEGVSGLPPKSNKDPVLYEVLDWINVRSGMKHDFDVALGKSCGTFGFLDRIHFYPSDRIDGNHNLKDACAVSYLTEKQLEEFEYSELMSRFKTEEVMIDCGITGSSNGVGRNLPIRLESSHREKFPMSDNRYEGLPDNFIIDFKYITNYPTSVNSYLNYLMLGVRSD